jgi:hypothetical protein
MDLAEPGELFKISGEVNMVVSSATKDKAEKSVRVNQDEIIMYLETEKCNSGGFYHWFLTPRGERVCFFYLYWLERSLKVKGDAIGNDVSLHKVEI